MANHPIAAASRRMHFLIPTYQDEAIKALAKRSGKSTSAVIRIALDALLEALEIEIPPEL